MECGQCFPSQPFVVLENQLKVYVDKETKPYAGN